MAALAIPLALGIPGAVAGIISAIVEGKRLKEIQERGYGMRKRGSALSHFANIPFPNRVSTYATGGARKRKGRGAVTPASILKTLGSYIPDVLELGMGKRSSRRGRGDISPDYFRSLIMGPHMLPYAHNLQAMTLGQGRKRSARGGAHPAAHFVKPHLSHTKYGDPIHVRGHMAAGRRRSAAGLIEPSGGRRRGGMANLLSPAGGALPAVHYVKPHLSHTKYGDPIHVRGHMAAGRRRSAAGMLLPSPMYY